MPGGKAKPCGTCSRWTVDRAQSELACRSCPDHQRDHHYIVLIAMTLAVGLLWNSHLMKVGIVAGWAVALAYALVANQLLYGALIAALLLAFFEKQSE